MAKKIRVLIADDSALMRRTLRRILEADDELEVLDMARDGEDAVAKARELRPDVVSMDINMPKLDGITALQMILEEKICPVVMVSSLTQKGAATTFEALELGAFDYVAKPGGTVSADMSSVAAELAQKLKSAASSGMLKRMRKFRAAETLTGKAKPAPPAYEPLSRVTCKAVVIGISTGGPATIMEVLPKIPGGLNAVFFLVQHMPATFTNTYARRLNDACNLEVVECESGMEVKPGYCYVGKGDYHMTLFKKASGQIVIRTPSTPETLFRPCVSVTMDAVFTHFGKNTIAVEMTGIGDDGADMMVKIAQNGGYTIAESKESCVVYGMPREAIERGGAMEVRPSWEIAEAILKKI